MNIYKDQDIQAIKNSKRKGQAKFARFKSIDIYVEDSHQAASSVKDKLPKPSWLKVKAPSENALRLKELLRKYRLHSVCEEASCPNLAECFEKKIATFMILGDICTRKCTFCDVAHGKPKPIDPLEPENLSIALGHMGLKYIVITSVDRDDLKDGGASHFAACIKAIRERSPNTKIEILVPDFRGKVPLALSCLANNLPNVFNHNIETVPRLYKTVRPGSNYAGSLALIKQFKQQFPHIPTKSGIMVGLGETDEEVQQVLIDLRTHNCDMLTIGQYLQPSKFHASVDRFVTPEQFKQFASFAQSIGFINVASGALVRSSYYAEQQAAQVV